MGPVPPRPYLRRGSPEEDGARERETEDLRRRRRISVRRGHAMAARAGSMGADQRRPHPAPKAGLDLTAWAPFLPQYKVGAAGGRVRFQPSLFRLQVACVPPAPSTRLPAAGRLFAPHTSARQRPPLCSNCRCWSPVDPATSRCGVGS
jgi:hypothetical protein